MKDPLYSARGSSAVQRRWPGIAAATAVFVISDEPVSFSEFARLFRDGLLCSDALYLDGVISELVAPSLNRKDRSGVLGPIVAVFER